MNPKRIVVGLSGGVDSSVAAYLLKQQGYDVIGVTMVNFREENREDSNGTGADKIVHDAAKVAEFLGIPHHVVDFCPQFKESVIDYFIKEYFSGRTPNPCVVCNRYIKWKAMMEQGEKLGADYLATGHYARVEALSRADKTTITKAFLDTIQTAGYRAMIYGNKEWLLKRIDLSKLKDYDVRLSQQKDIPDYPYKFSMWQYTTSAEIHGINGYANLNVCFIDYSAK